MAKITVNKDSFSVSAQADIVDSLEDARENHENARAILGTGEAAELAATLAYEYGRVLDAFMDGYTLGYDDTHLILSALQRSINNCVENDLDEAEAGYRAALAEVVPFLIGME